MSKIIDPNHQNLKLPQEAKKNEKFGAATDITQRIGVKKIKKTKSNLLRKLAKP